LTLTVADSVNPDCPLMFISPVSEPNTIAPEVTRVPSFARAGTRIITEMAPTARRVEKRFTNGLLYLKTSPGDASAVPVSVIALDRKSKKIVTTQCSKLIEASRWACRSRDTHFDCVRLVGALGRSRGQLRRHVPRNGVRAESAGGGADRIDHQS